MNLQNEINKDWNQFMREGRTLILMLAVPVMVIIIMGAVFSSDIMELKKTSLGVCDIDQSNSSQLFISGIANNTDLIDYGNRMDCNLSLYQDVMTGKLTAAFIIPSGFEAGIINGQTQNITIFLDNSRFQVSPTIESYMAAAVQSAGQKIGAEFIIQVWSQLNQSDAKLVELLDNINETRDRAFEMKSSLADTSASLESLDITSVRINIALANQTVNATYQSLENAEGNLTKIESDFQDYDLTLNQTESDLNTINQSLFSLSANLLAYKSGVDCTDLAFIAYCLTIDSINSSLYPIQSSIESRLIKVQEARADLYLANITIQEFKSDISTAKNSSAEANEKIIAMSNFIDQLEENRNSALATIAEIDYSLDQIISKTYELEDLIMQSRAQINTITSRTPESVLSPILLFSNNLLGEKTFFGFMLPSLIPLVLMFVALFLSSTSLVREKSYGTFNRISLAQVHPLEFVFTKVISYTIVMVPSAIILLLLSSLGYAAFDILDSGIFLLVALTLTLLVFVSLGVLIALYSESEATAFLASLVIGLPLLFMGGLLFPFEFMPSQAAAIGLASPLTQSMVAMQSAITYNSPSVTSLFSLLFYGILISLASSIVLHFSNKK